MRIGLAGDGRTVTLESSGGLYIVDRDSGRDVWKHLHKGVVRVVLQRGVAPEPPAEFQVQVASLISEEEAEALKSRLEADTGEVVTVTRNPDRNAWRVRVGRRASREEIRQVEDKLRELGFSEIWVVQEAAARGKEPRLRLVDEEYNDMPTAAKALLVLPAAEGRPVKVADQPYRGVVEVLLTRGRQLKAVNVLNREDYLKGVVPKELGPGIYPELEALKAQAVAARTYTESNRGQFVEDGFDICDSARCQVYGGMSAEHPLSDFAVEQTSGVIATFEGKPINALYTSTCGGHTEDLKNVFREMTGTYLKGVPCYADEEALLAARRAVRGAWDGISVVMPGGGRLDEPLAGLEVLGVLSPDETRADQMAAALDARQTGEWTRRSLKAAGKRPPPTFAPDRQILDVATLGEYLVEAFGWNERVTQLLSPADLPALLGPEALLSTQERSRAALAYAVKEEIIPPMRPAASGGSGPDDPATRALLARGLYKMIARYEATGMQAGRYRGSRGDTVGLQSEGTLTFYPLAARLHLLVKDQADTYAVADRLLQGGDALEYHVSSSGAIDCLAFKSNQRGASDDRFSNLYAWEVRVPRSELASRIRSRASVGDLVDIIPGSRGVSGRIVDLAVVGSAGRFTFHGFSIESLLGLRETLFMVDRQYGDDGKVETFIFAGKGWGHGVGMCQVGAYGMALRGKTYEEILHHYYTGVTLERR